MGPRTFVARSRIGVPPKELFDWHARPGAFARLAPPWDDVETVGPEVPLTEGSRRVLSVRIGPTRRRWVAVHRDIEPGRQFVDEQESGPFASWVHTHRFEPDGEGGSILEDRIEYVLPLGALGELLGAAMADSNLRRMFRYRHDVTTGDLERHDRYRDRPRLRVAITGASGLVGSALAAFLGTGGHDVVRVVRRESAGPNEIRWDPSGGGTDPSGWNGLDAVVHLAGENIADGRWSPDRKRRIRDSRVGGTRLIAETLAGIPAPPKVLVSASAVGWYGPRGDEPVDEDSPAGSGFLAEVCREWEAATAPAAEAGVRVVLARIGIVLSAAGGALAKMLPLFRVGLGGRLGDGRQYMPWISLDDLVGVLHAALQDDRLSGPVNAVAPGAVTNAEFTRRLGEVLGRPTPFPAPAFALRLAMGEMADEMLLAGANVRPARLQEVGFPFRHPELGEALRFELGRSESSEH